MLVGLPGLLTPWVPFYELHDDARIVTIAFVNFFNMPALGFAQTPLRQAMYAIDTSPIFLPFLILARQLLRVAGRPQSYGRIIVTLLMAWVVYHAAISVWELPAQVIESLAGGGDLDTRLVAQGIRVAGLFVPIVVGGLLVLMLLVQPSSDSIDAAECSAMITYVIAVLPELVTDAVNARLSAHDVLLPVGYGLLLWTCVAYCVATARLLVLWRPPH